jgi:hypothetical protein
MRAASKQWLVVRCAEVLGASALHAVRSEMFIAVNDNTRPLRSEERTLRFILQGQHPLLRTEKVCFVASQTINISLGYGTRSGSDGIQLSNAVKSHRYRSGYCNVGVSRHAPNEALATGSGSTGGTHCCGRDTASGCLRSSNHFKHRYHDLPVLGLRRAIR